MNPRSILALVKGILADQREGSDYDALYFGLQDVEEMLIDLSRKTTHRTARVRGHGDSVYAKKKKLSAWQLFVKANASKPRFKYKSGAKKGRINLKALGVAYRKTPAGKKSSRR